MCRAATSKDGLLGVHRGQEALQSGGDAMLLFIGDKRRCRAAVTLCCCCKKSAMQLYANTKLLGIPRKLNCLY